MINDEGETVDLYIPRKWYSPQSVCNLIGTSTIIIRFTDIAVVMPSLQRCKVLQACGYSIFQALLTGCVLLCSAYTNKLITAKDHAAVQINMGHLNENGQYVDGNFTTFALAGNVRAMVRGS